MPKNWEARETKVEKRKTRMPKHGLDSTRAIQAAIVKRGNGARGTERAYKGSGGR